MPGRRTHGRRPTIFEGVLENAIWDVAKLLLIAISPYALSTYLRWRQAAKGRWRWLRGADIVRLKRKQSPVVASGEDSLDAILQREASKIDWDAVRAFQESLGRPELSERELYDYLRQEGFGVPKFWERGKRRWFTLKEAFAEPGRGYLNPIETALNEIVWQVDNKWICPSPDLEIPPMTPHQRISGHAILRVIRKLYGLPSNKEIWLKHRRLQASYEAYHVRLYMPGVSTVSEEKQPSEV